MTDSSSKLLQAQGRWYQERKATKIPKPEQKNQKTILRPFGNARDYPALLHARFSALPEVKMGRKLNMLRFFRSAKKIPLNSQEYQNRTRKTPQSGTNWSQDLCAFRISQSLSARRLFSRYSCVGYSSPRYGHTKEARSPGKEHGSLPQPYRQTLLLDPIALHVLNLETSATRLARALFVNGDKSRNRGLTITRGPPTSYNSCQIRTFFSNRVFQGMARLGNKSRETSHWPSCSLVAGLSTQGLSSWYTNKTKGPWILVTWIHHRIIGTSNLDRNLAASHPNRGVLTIGCSVAIALANPPKMLGEGERRLRSSVSAFAVDSNMIATWRQTWE